ncbi:hypothetical protein BBJ28_00019599 [Nothophytophthora sp. Chile5]|nr:hypothetical protein BBJ28_00019599 [Nothophytophthora sp. Chile5]
MSGSDVAIVIFKILTIVTTILMRVSLLPDFQRMRKQRSTGDMSVLPCVLLYTNCYVLCWYSYLVDDILPLFATSVLGVVTGIILAAFFYRWTAHKRTVINICIVSCVVIILETIYGVIAVLGGTGQSLDSVGTTMGIITVVSSIGLYASPLATIRRVIRTKSASSMPFTMGVVNVLNSICWVVYAALVDDMFVLAPNAAGALLGSIQLVLYVIYPAKTPTEGQIVSATIEDPRASARGSVCGEQASLSVVIHSPVQEDGNSRKDSAVDGGKSPSFVALRSPRS